jgi:hypothetical protein
VELEKTQWPQASEEEGQTGRTQSSETPPCDMTAVDTRHYSLIQTHRKNSAKSKPYRLLCRSVNPGSLPIFKNWVIWGSLLRCCVSFSYILESTTLSDTWLAHILSPHSLPSCWGFPRHAAAFAWVSPHLFTFVIFISAFG